MSTSLTSCQILPHVNESCQVLPQVSSHVKSTSNDSYMYYTRSPYTSPYPCTQTPSYQITNVSTHLYQLLCVYSSLYSSSSSRITLILICFTSFLYLLPLHPVALIPIVLLPNHKSNLCHDTKFFLYLITRSSSLMLFYPYTE